MRERWDCGSVRLHRVQREPYLHRLEEESPPMLFRLDPVRDYRQFRKKDERQPRELTEGAKNQREYL